MSIFSHWIAGRVALFNNRTSIASRPTTASSGTAITQLKPLLNQILDLGANGGDCTLAGPVELFGYRATQGTDSINSWYKIGELNSGKDITLYNGGAGYSEVFQHLKHFDRLELRAAAISANGYDAYAANVDITD